MTDKAKQFLLHVANILDEKNIKYGNSALEPVRVFSSSDKLEQLRVRIDDKLSRIKAGNLNDDEDVLTDLVGYLALYAGEVWNK